MGSRRSLQGADSQNIRGHRKYELIYIENDEDNELHDT